MSLQEFYASLKPAPFGIEQEYTFYQDFQIADRVGGEKAVLGTWKRVQHWQSNPRAWGEVTCTLNIPEAATATVSLFNVRTTFYVLFATRNK